ncbi:hypothetical protein GO730_00570 [Spirosoma sp. HMF3257]|uniref:Uncharacterized protein n=1 Tax=Spirosoma telluris TaxID=2183553 RepID=A0A327NEW2_9BACT|nr:hypothetical protein [Spirosoma telluris]RAI73293.1 hypothetical protein HMF3257_00555 [Spirosoma telluris]
MAFPAPARFTDLRQHLHKAGIDAARLSFVLEDYLGLPDNMPRQDWFLDPQEDHQAWGFREAICEFQKMIADKTEGINE